MDKKIPIYFDSVIVSSPLEIISENNPNLGRLKVRVFTKYGNRNGSYITEKVANQLIDSATKGNVPVVGFFDPETQSWASHSGPTLANAYGYVEDFIGWEPFVDTDGITRDYAVFSVIIFTDYFEEAKKILGQNQSMELNPATIQGTWTMIGEEEYFVYTSAEMLGFCIIGDHEPCFSVSAFFSKNDENYDSQFDKFASLLEDLKSQVESFKSQSKGGEQPMDEFEIVENPVVEEPQVEEVEFEAEESTAEETVVDEQENVEEEPSDFEKVETEETIEETEETETSEFELLQNHYNELEKSYNELKNAYEQEKAEFEKNIADLQASVQAFEEKYNAATEQIKQYEAIAAQNEKNEKVKLIDNYRKLLTEEEIAPISEQIDSFTYSELEAKLAITFANNKITGSEEKKVPLPDPEKSQFALLIEKYRKN